MSGTESDFVWYDIMTTDLVAAEKFYRDVIGWKIDDSGSRHQVYKILSAGSRMVGGMMPAPEAMKDEVDPVWFGYIWVSDVDEYAERVKQAGGAVHRGPMDIPDIGRFAVASDPHGATFILFRPTIDERSEPVAPGTLGHVGWHELHAGDLEEAWNFYSGLFGWKRGDSMDMGPMGIYQLFSAGEGMDGKVTGGMMTKAAAIEKPHWLYYFNVDGVSSAMKRVQDAGGTVSFGPQEVPGGAWIAMCSDPQGAQFAITSANR